jgi:hypothetical protein
MAMTALPVADAEFTTMTGAPNSSVTSSPAGSVDSDTGFGFHARDDIDLRAERGAQQ